jgi:molybdenum cofactor guanylyltransferase
MLIKKLRAFNTFIMTGLVLCGGQSARMGCDKGLISTASGSWAALALAKMEKMNLPVFLSVNAAQHANYAAIFSEERLIADDTSMPVKGPLIGILSAHRRFPEQDLLVLACDMPLIDTALLQLLLEQWQKHPSGALVFSNKGAPEPLCGIYSAAGLSAMELLQQSGQLRKHSLKYVLKEMKAPAIPLSPLQQVQFSNFNTPADLDGL